MIVRETKRKGQIFKLLLRVIRKIVGYLMVDNCCTVPDATICSGAAYPELPSDDEGRGSEVVPHVTL
jgi:hypothetical protein